MQVKAERFWQGSDGKSLLMLDLFSWRENLGLSPSTWSAGFFGSTGLGASAQQDLGSAQGLLVLTRASRTTCNTKERDDNSQPPESNLN